MAKSAKKKKRGKRRSDSGTEPARLNARWAPSVIDPLVKKLSAIRAELKGFEQKFEPRLNEVHLPYRESARNLLHYVCLRRHDLRPLQERLVELGLSSLGRSESSVLATIDAVLNILRGLGRSPAEIEPVRDDVIDFRASKALMEAHDEALLGPKPSNRAVRVMVTMPTEAADDYKLVRALIEGGADCVRINCAHDDRETWARMVDNVRKARAELDRPCRILMDLAGPKLRTGALATGNQVVRWQPRRDCFGKVVDPALIWVAGDNDAPPPPVPVDAKLPVAEEWQSHLKVGEQVALLDARGRSRRLNIVKEVGQNRLAESTKTTYIVPNTVLHWDPGSRGRQHPRHPVEGRVGPLAAVEQPLILHKGDTLLLMSNHKPGRPARRRRDGKVIRPASIGCSLPEVFCNLQVGERVLLDDGRLGGVIAAIDKDGLHVEITQARSGGDNLRSDKGINFPDSELKLAPLTEKDIKDLAFIVNHADLVGYSFVRCTEDVTVLLAEMAKLGGENLGLLLKIENRQAFESLTGLLLEAMKSPAAGVMIARGDLAIECGYERLAEIQEEMLWMCEAAHMPVVWATQVLESLAKQGQPSRAEITDAAMGERAECVMLNKGPYIIEALRTLDDILRRMQEHQKKKRSMLGKLKMADGLPRMR
jgi:pyruvate kinase